MKCPLQNYKNIIIKYKKPQQATYFMDIDCAA